MSGTLTTRVLFKGTDLVTPTLRKIQASVVGTQKTIQNFQRGINRAGRGMRNAGMIPTAAITMPTTIATRSIINARVEMEEAMNELSKRSTITSNKQLQQFKKQADELAAVTKFKAAGIVKAQTELSAAGLAADEVLAITKPVIFGSIAADMAPAKFADEMTNIVTAYNGVTKGAESWRSKITEVSEALALVSASSNTTFNEALDSFKQFAPVARQLKIDTKTAIGLIGAMANVGFKASTGGRAFRTGFVRSLMMSAKAMRLLRQEGINFTDWVDLDPAKMTADRFVKSMETIAPSVKKNMGQVNGFFGQSTADMVTNLGSFTTALNESLGFKGDDAVKVENRIAEFILTSAKKMDPLALLKAMQKASIPAQKELFSMFQVSKFGGLTADGGQGVSDVIAEMNRKREEIFKKINPLTGTNYKSVVAFMANQEMKGLPGALKILENAADRLKRKVFSAFDYTDEFGVQQNSLTDSIGKFAVATGKFADNMNPAMVKIAALGATIAAFAGPALIYLGLAAMGFSALLKPLALLTAPLKFFATRLGTVAVAGATFRAVLGRLGIVGAAMVAAWYGITGLVDGFNNALKNSPAAAEKASQGMVALKAAMRNIGTGNYKDAFGWFTISIERFAATIKPSIAKIFEGIGNIDIDFDGKLDKFYESITKLTEAFAPFGEAWKQFQQDIGATGKGTDQIIWDGIKNIGEGGLALTIDVITSALDTMATAINGVGEASKSAAKGEFTDFLDNIIKIVPDVIKEIAKLGPAMIESVGLKGKVETGTWEEWGNRVSRIIKKVGRLLEKVGRKIASILPKSWREKMGIAAPHAEAVSEFQDNVIPTIRPFKLSTMPDLPDFAANDNRADSLNGDTIGGLKGQVDAANIVKAAAELAAKEAERTTKAVEAQTGEQARNTAQIVSAIHSSFNSAGHWQGNPASEADGAPDAPIPISSNGGAGIHP